MRLVLALLTAKVTITGRTGSVERHERGQGCLVATRVPHVGGRAVV